ncbi:MAG TPA: TonB-dependent receptor [Nevskiaceae bacterium]|nr:TonB-dependent receptor [Nevskiaceae bacterium]
MTLPSSAPRFHRLACCGLALWPAALLAAPPPEAPAPAPTEQTAPPASPASAEAVTLEPLTVTGFVRRYYEAQTETGLGFAADTLETPLSVIAIPSDLLEDQQVNTVEDALRNVAGVTKFKQGNGGEEKFSIRGFDASQNLLIDGARLNNQFNATNIATTETANIERYEILKGPAAILQGQGLPGGIINYVTKKPSFQPARQLEYLQGSDDYHRLELDATGPLLDRQLAGRGVLAWQDSEGYRDFDARQRLLLNPSLLWQPATGTRVLASVSLIDDRYTQDRGQALLQLDDGRYVYPAFLRPETFLGIPGWNERTESEYRRAALEASQALTPDWTLRLSAARTEVDKTLFDSSVRSVSAEGTVAIRASFQAGEGRTDYLRLDNQLRFDGPWSSRHEVLLSIAQDQLRNDGYSQSGSTISYDSRTGSYSSREVTLAPDRFALRTDAVNRTVSLQDLVRLGERWVLLAGAGYSEFEDELSGQGSEAVSPRLGLIYQPRAHLSLYASHARGFYPSTLSDLQGRLLDAEALSQHELGVKMEGFEQRLLLTAALFDLEQRGQAVLDPASPDPDNDPRYRSLGQTRTRGLDAQVVGELPAGWRLIGGYAWLDNETDNDAFGGSLPAGNRLPGIPEHSGSLWAVREVRDGALRGLGFGGGLFAQSDVFIGLENRSRYGGWTQLDATAFYKRDRLKVQLNLRNALDRDYRLTQALASESLAAVRVGTSTPRQLFLSVASEF